MIRIHRRPRAKPTLNIAPLVDCIFLLLIFFLLASTFSRGDVSRADGLEIELPGAESAEPEEKEVLRVCLAESGEIVVEKRKVSLAELTDVLQAAVRERGPLPLFLVADRRVRLETLTEVIDRARKLGVRSVSIATQKPPAGGAGPTRGGEK
jgi:biopolymer transport protein ExbD